MSRLKPGTQRLLETAARYEELPSRERMTRVRAAVLRRAALGGVAAVATSSGLWAKASLFAATATGQVATYAVAGALAGGIVVQIAVPASPRVVTATSAQQTSTPLRAPVATPLAAPVIDPPMTTDTPARSPSPNADTAPGMPAKAPHAGAPSAPWEPAARRERPSDAPNAVAPPARHPATFSTSAPTVMSAPGAATGDVAAAERSANEAPYGRDALRPQLDVLQQMRLDLAAQRSASALELYRTNAQLFRGSALETEARAAYIAALCQQGRSDEALREAVALQQAFPSSHLARRLVTGCASGAAFQHPR